MRAVLEKIFSWAPAGEGFRRLALPALLAGSAGVLFWTVSVVYNTSKLTSLTTGQEVNFTLARESLAGLEGLKVVVEDLPQRTRQGGLTEDVLRPYLEMRLRQARIPVLSRDEWMASERQPYLYLNVIAIRTAAGGWTYSLGLDVNQNACIKGGVEGQGLLALAGGCSTFRTWHEAGLYTTGQPLPDSVRGNLAELMDQFVNDYLTVNP